MPVVCLGKIVTIYSFVGVLEEIPHRYVIQVQHMFLCDAVDLQPGVIESQALRERSITVWVACSA